MRVDNFLMHILCAVRFFSIMIMYNFVKEKFYFKTDSLL